MPLISVIVPVYKVEPYLCRCVDSILAQTYTDFELILVDDGSPDNCGAICDEYAQRDSRVHVIHQENGGLSAARNAGIDWVFANGDSKWITFVDSDDWIHPQMLEQLYLAVTVHQCRVSICTYKETKEEFDWSTCKIGVPECRKVEAYYIQNWGNATVAWGKLYSKDCFENIRYPVGKIYEDGYVTYKILFREKQVAVIETQLYAYYINLHGISKSRWTLERLDGIQSLEEQLLFFKSHGYLQAWETAVIKYVYALCGQYVVIMREAGKKDKRVALRYIKPRLVYAFFKYWKRFPFIKENWFVYESVFPNLMKAYWLSQVVIEKARNWFSRGFFN